MEGADPAQLFPCSPTASVSSVSTSGCYPMDSRTTNSTTHLNLLQHIQSYNSVGARGYTNYVVQLRLPIHHRLLRLSHMVLTPGGGIPMPSPSNSGNMALLSWIGGMNRCMMKWGARKKRASSSPSKVVLQEAKRERVRTPGMFLSFCSM